MEEHLRKAETAQDLERSATLQKGSVRGRLKKQPA
jgi:hypothetical protein